MLGVDVSKATLSCSVVDAQTRRRTLQFVVANTEPGIRTLLQKVPRSPVVLEPTGRYSLLLARLAKDDGRMVLLAEPRKAKAFLRSLPNRAKTDTLDSEGLARYALSCPLAPYPLKDPAVQHLDELLSARKGLVRQATAIKQQARELPAGAPYLLSALRAMNEQLNALDRAIAAATRADPRFEVVRHLQSIPGVGPLTSAAVASCLVARQFTNPDQFVAFVGLDPQVHQSGQKDSRGAISKRGDPELRRLLFLCAQANTRCKSSPFKDFYQHRRDLGMASTPALCAVARKLARTCWSLWKYNNTFDPNRAVTPLRPKRT